ncbi:MAG: SigE family RNA polymerase sigma factor [Propionibacteriaceae bacterium]|jgi:RNA polymerase sigma-70 factor (sigma-E family)|nr:SigE family RNA polymerase sigma factor [Propionibacteriaceae bacterium]
MVLERGPVLTQDIGFEAYVAANWAALHRFAHAMIGNPEDAADAVQEALISVRSRWLRITGNPDAYIHRAIMNAHTDAWRKRRREYATDEVQTQAVPDFSDSVDDARHLVQLVGGLPKRQRAAVVLRYLEDRSYPEVAQILATSEANARSLVRYGLKALREQYEGESHA